MVGGRKKYSFVVRAEDSHSQSHRFESASVSTEGKSIKMHNRSDLSTYKSCNNFYFQLVETSLSKKLQPLKPMVN